MAGQRRLAAAGLAGFAGLAVIVVGTFLPWLRSGRATHNSYQADGTVQRLLDIRGPLRTALAVWPFVGLACAAVAALFALGLRASAAVLGLVLGAGAGAVAIGVLNVRGNTFARPAHPGPIVTLTGVILLMATATLLLLGRRGADGHGRDRP
jgi:hypothetical protein